jgi:hypothetical protein
MVKLKGNFEADWIAHLRAHLTQVQGWDANEVASLDDSEIPSNFFEGLRRKLAPQARVLKVADDFQCSPTESTGWNALQDKVRKGEDLNPHLSNRHASLFNNDGLLAEWGCIIFISAQSPTQKFRLHGKDGAACLCVGRRSNILRNQYLSAWELGRNQRH